MTTTVHSRGICQTCGNSAACTYPETASEPRVECEEFAAPGAPAASRAGISQSRPSRADSDEKLLGLCSNCQARSACALHKPESGIWFCEEYR
jgi:hypothetical protein